MSCQVMILKKALSFVSGSALYHMHMNSFVLRSSNILTQMTHGCQHELSAMYSSTKKFSDHPATRKRKLPGFLGGFEPVVGNPLGGAGGI